MAAGGITMRYAALGRVFAAALAVAFSGPVLAQSKNLAPGFTSLPKGAKVVLMPTDIELFSISAGGVLEPKADWTEAASKYFKSAMIEKQKKLGLSMIELSGAAGRRGRRDQRPARRRRPRHRHASFRPAVAADQGRQARLVDGRAGAADQEDDRRRLRAVQLGARQLRERRAQGGDGGDRGPHAWAARSRPAACRRATPPSST